MNEKKHCRKKMTERYSSVRCFLLTAGSKIA
jgi:hypothetical protein